MDTSSFEAINLSPLSSLFKLISPEISRGETTETLKTQFLQEYVRFLFPGLLSTCAELYFCVSMFMDM